MDSKYAGTGYLALPEGGAGPGILVLHAWWGLTDHVRHVCDQLASEGYVALAPDLFDGRVATEIEEAEKGLAEADANELAHLTRSSLAALRSMVHTPDGPVGLLGWSMGASMALWLSARVPDDVVATAVYYGGQDIDMEDARCAFLGHYAETDAYVDEDGLVLLESELHLDGLEVEFHRYPGTSHWFAEPDRPEHDPRAAAQAWDRTLDFFESYLPTGR
jgi:carboxymethylenebutenolidase